jgi:predicted nucleic acid-binding protein
VSPPARPRASRSAVVLDASAACAVLFREPELALVLSALGDNPRLVVPPLFALEVANVARTKVRRRELSREAAEVLLDGIEKWPLDVVHVDWKDAWRLAWKHELTVYDAAYLWLSVDRELPLVTLDGELADAAGTRARP